MSRVDGDLTIKEEKYMNTLNADSIVVGVDVHKYSHTAVAMNAWGEEKGMLNFTNNTLNMYGEWLERMGLKENIIVGLEDVNSYGIHLVENLRTTIYDTCPPSLRSGNAKFRLNATKAMQSTQSE